MKLFVSWSGNRSKAVAETLAIWLQQTIQAVDAWISTDLEKGVRWGHEITEKLRESTIGIFCVLPENVSAPWLLFEAGAISNTKDAHVCTLLVGLTPADVPLPLSQFQATVFEKEEVRRLLQTINSKLQTLGERALTEAVLDTVFERNWGDLEAQIARIAREALPGAPPRREAADMLEEALQILRELERRSISPAASFSLRDLGVAAAAELAPVTNALMQPPSVAPAADARRRLVRNALMAGLAAPLMAGGGGGAGDGT